MIYNRIYLQIIFYIILFLSSIFNATNTNILIQFFFIGFALFFLLCNLKKNILHEIKYNFRKNKIFFIPLFLILIYIILQIIPLPIDIFGKYLPIHLELINNLGLSKKYITISVDPSDTYFQILNFLNLIIAAGTKGFNCDKGPLIYSSLVLIKYSRSFPSKILGISFAIILNNTGSNSLAVQ